MITLKQAMKQLDFSNVPTKSIFEGAGQEALTSFKSLVRSKKIPVKPSKAYKPSSQYQGYKKAPVPTADKITQQRKKTAAAAANAPKLKEQLQTQIQQEKARKKEEKAKARYDKYHKKHYDSHSKLVHKHLTKMWGKEPSKEQLHNITSSYIKNKYDNERSAAKKLKTAAKPRKTKARKIARQEMKQQPQVDKAAQIRKALGID